MLARAPLVLPRHHFGEVMITMALVAVSLSICAPGLACQVWVIDKHDILVGSYGVNHPCLIVIALGNLAARMIKHSHGQSHLRPMMDRGARCQAGTEEVRIDALAEGIKRALTDRLIESITGEGATNLAQPNPVC
jgi:hypothetical protein